MLKLILGYSFLTCGITSNHDLLCWYVFLAERSYALCVHTDPFFTVLSCCLWMVYIIIVRHFLTSCLTCRGNDPYGAIGDGTRFNTYQLPTVSGGGLKFSDFSFGFSHHCGLLFPSGQMNCWGEGTAGQLGDGLSADRWIPGPLGGGHAGTSWISFQCASDYTAGIDVAGKIYTWGYEWFGNLAQSVPSGTIVPVPNIVAGTYPQFVQVAAGDRTICARTTSKMMYCSGDGTLGQTGNGGSYTVLTEVIPGSTVWQWGPQVWHDTMVAGLTAASPLDLRSWGLNDMGQGGAGNAGVNMMAPTIPTYLPTTFYTYSIGRHHACGIDSYGTGSVFCIGDNTWGTYVHR
jgi:hypothetical protein